ncbi:hypothetical protein [Alteraurantiacibacter palmitatis]|uniref:Uncharacterized protein n=2 Tax=Alteraurantiacibacter palmitatis TaxID=2054628 RepID=A0ABV7E3P7_9SPHN
MGLPRARTRQREGKIMPLAQVKSSNPKALKTLRPTDASHCNFGLSVGRRCEEFDDIAHADKIAVFRPQRKITDNVNGTLRIEIIPLTAGKNSVEFEL